MTVMTAQLKVEGFSLKIGEVSRLSGIGIEALRFYEKQGLLGSPRRTSSGYRLYNGEVLERLQFIKQAQALGFSLREIAQIIAEKESGQKPCQRVRELVRNRLTELEEQIRQMRRYKKELTRALAQWDEDGDVDGHVCGLIESARLEPESLRNKFTGPKSASEKSNDNKND